MAQAPHATSHVPLSALSATAPLDRAAADVMRALATRAGGEGVAPPD